MALASTPRQHRLRPRGGLPQGQRRASEKDAKLAQKLGQLQPFIAVSHRNAWANWHLLGQPNTFLAAVLRGVRRRGVHRPRAGPLALQAEHAAAGQPAGLPEVGLVSVSAIKC